MIITYSYCSHHFNRLNTRLIFRFHFWLQLIQSSITATPKSTYHKTDGEIKEEIRLIKLSQQDPKKFAPLYMKYHDQIFLFINKRVDNLELTADLTSKTFLKCLKYIHKFKDLGVPFSSWLYKIAINEVNMYGRKNKHFVRTVSIEDSHLHSLVEEIDYSEPLLDSKILVPVLLEQLNEYEIQFVELRFFENKSFKEIGFLLGMSEGNAKIKTYRILKKLKSLSKTIQYH